MIRITVQETNDTVCLIVEGKLNGPWVPELESVARRISVHSSSKALSIDLASISGMDSSGRLLLTRLRAEGVRLTNLDPLSESLLTMEEVAA